MTASYSYSWADRTVTALEKKYARATEIFYKITGVTHRHMVYYIAHNDPIFPQLRDLIHFIDRISQSGPFLAQDGAPAFYRANLYALAQKKNMKRFTDYLDKQLFLFEAERAVNEAGADEA